jgi:hypothetical protein
MRRSGVRGAFAVALAFLLAAAAVHAQLVPPDPDWREADAPPPPALKTEGLIPLEIPGSGLRYGVDPSSVSVTGDGVVRYVVVATSSSGAINALYEGIHCSTGEFKVYARLNAGSGWVIAKDPIWHAFEDVPQSRHSLLVARTAACMGHGPNGTAAQVVHDLRAPLNMRFNEPK